MNSYVIEGFKMDQILDKTCFLVNQIGTFCLSSRWCFNPSEIIKKILLLVNLFSPSSGLISSPGSNYPLSPPSQTSDWCCCLPPQLGRENASSILNLHSVTFHNSNMKMTKNFTFTLDCRWNFLLVWNQSKRTKIALHPSHLLLYIQLKGLETSEFFKFWQSLSLHSLTYTL